MKEDEQPTTRWNKPGCAGMVKIRWRSDFTLDANGESVMNVDWKRGSNAYWVLNPDNHNNGRFYSIDVHHFFQGLDAGIVYTEDKEKIILTGNQNIDAYAGSVPPKPNQSIHRAF